MKKVLAIEDDVFFQLLIKKSLEGEFVLTVVPSIADARNALIHDKYDLIIVDVMLPDGSGLDMCTFLRSQDDLKHVPIIIVSAQNEVDSKITGLDFGADDYVTKPFHPKELVARIHARLRQSQASDANLDFIQLGSYRIDLVKHRVFDPAGNILELTQVEFKLLVYFARHTEHVLSRSQILEGVWPDNLHITERVVDTHVSNLRKKIGKLGLNIKSIHGVGYTFSIAKAA